MARDNSENLVYAASKALWKSEQRSRRREGALTRLFRFFRTVKKTKAELTMFIISIVLLCLMTPILLANIVLIISAAVHPDKIPQIFCSFFMGWLVTS